MASGLGVVLSAVSLDLGSFGPTWLVAETNLLQQIQQQLHALDQSGELAAHQRQIQQKTLARLKRPTPVSGLRPTTVPRTFRFDPTITVPYDLKDHTGRLIHQAGTTVNPLHTHSLTQSLLFIDGDDKDQVAWAMKLAEPSKIILTNGSPFDLMEQHPDRTVYFDQHGALTGKLGIQQIPARVTQSGDQLQIEELETHALQPSSHATQPEEKPF